MSHTLPSLRQSPIHIPGALSTSSSRSAAARTLVADALLLAGVVPPLPSRFLASKNSGWRLKKEDIVVGLQVEWLVHLG